mmetsp:Transcript_110215/g.310877  ORF Transcript_110215/g.310877 Transcript_110215/m.310877 type:complete len:269 (+) Transcript_110215:698-1504(+)
MAWDSFHISHCVRPSCRSSKPWIRAVELEQTHLWQAGSPSALSKARTSSCRTAKAKGMRLTCSMLKAPSSLALCSDAWISSDWRRCSSRTSCSGPDSSPSAAQTSSKTSPNEALSLACSMLKSESLKDASHCMLLIHSRQSAPSSLASGGGLSGLAGLSALMGLPSEAYSAAPSVPSGCRHRAVGGMLMKSSAIRQPNRQTSSKLNVMNVSYGTRGETSSSVIFVLDGDCLGTVVASDAPSQVVSAMQASAGGRIGGSRSLLSMPDAD